MATVKEPDPSAITAHFRPVSPDRRIAFAATWELYQSLAKAVGDQHVRVAFDGERVEIMSPGQDHEEFKILADRLVVALADANGLPCKSYGSSRWLRVEARRGIEADTCFYLTLEKVAVARSRPRTNAEYPMPDLAVEIDVSPPEVDRAGIFSALGVVEVWRFDGEAAWIDRLQTDGSYSPASQSGWFPGFRPEHLVFLLTTVAAESLGDSDYSRRVEAWARANLPARPGA